MSSGHNRSAVNQLRAEYIQCARPLSSVLQNCLPLCANCTGTVCPEKFGPRKYTTITKQIHHRKTRHGIQNGNIGVPKYQVCCPKYQIRSIYLPYLLCWINNWTVTCIQTDLMRGWSTILNNLSHKYVGQIHWEWPTRVIIFNIDTGLILSDISGARIIFNNHASPKSCWTSKCTGLSYSISALVLCGLKGLFTNCFLCHSIQLPHIEGAWPGLSYSH